MSTVDQEVVVQAFIDALDVSNAPHEIRANTGLPEERCEEISKLFAKLVAEKEQSRSPVHRDEMGLTPEQRRRYFEKDGKYCPFCEDGAVEAGPIHNDEPLWSEVRCLECGRSWKDIYGVVDLAKPEESK
jgi:hypothetical protein